MSLVTTCGLFCCFRPSVEMAREDPTGVDYLPTGEERSEETPMDALRRVRTRWSDAIINEGGAAAVTMRWRGRKVVS